MSDEAALKDDCSHPMASPTFVKHLHSLNDCLLSNKNVIFLVLSLVEGVEEIARTFFGTVVSDLLNLPPFGGKTVYLSGDLCLCSQHLLADLKTAAHVLVIRELSRNMGDTTWPVVGVGRLPINVHGVGVFYRRFFDPELDSFSRIRVQHVFQSLTESNKPGTAHRTGLYLTPVEEQGEDLHFRLLRCSSNLSGPTDNFRSHDHHIVDSLNQEAACIFENQAPLNHVLAQVYCNTPSSGPGKKPSKAKIKAHSDKTKDMPANGLMAFVTFYDQQELQALQPLGDFDWGVRGRGGRPGQSALTQLHFRLKPCVWERDPASTLPRSFSVTLLPDSVFFMPLSTNRLYTHEIQPSALDALLLPTRLGYVVRCSSAEAVHRAGRTLLQSKEDGLVPLVSPTQEDMAALRQLYAEENRHDAVVEYGDVFFSMNEGDYLRPLARSVLEDFRWCPLPPCAALPHSGDLFAALESAVPLESVGRGRRGAVLVASCPSRGTPLVRTTTKYSTPARAFQRIHFDLAQHIRSTCSLLCEFNNALVEKYSSEYAAMGFHSDQAQDLQAGSSIAVFSCYKHPGHKHAGASRKLVIEAKTPDDTCSNPSSAFELPLVHNSVVVFSLDSNTRFRHKIVLDQSGGPPDKDQEWFGITFRTSSTFVKYSEEGTVLGDKSLLALAENGGAQAKELYTLRRLENERIGFQYPVLEYTISESDLMPPLSDC